MAEQIELITVPSPVAEITSFMTARGASDELTLMPLTEGCHNKIYLCENGPPDFPTKFVVRVPRCPEAARAINANLDYLEGMPAPRVLRLGVLALSGTPILVEEFVDGEQKDLNDLSQIEIDELAATLTGVHSRSSDFYSKVSGYRPFYRGTHSDYIMAMVTESVTGRIRTIDMRPYAAAGRALSAGIRKLKRCIDMHPLLFDETTFSLLHHDLNPGNILWRPDGSVAFIDWNITFGDPADDVDYVVTNNGVSSHLRDLFFESYSNATKSSDIVARVGAYTLKNQMDDLAWVISMHQRSASDPRYGPAAYAKRLTALQTTLDQTQLITR